MISAILSALAAAFQAVAGLFGWIKQRDLIQAGRDAERADTLGAQLQAERNANAIRENVGAALERDPSGVMSDDGFRRD